MSEAVVTNKPINRIINAPGTCTSNILTSNEVKAVIQNTVGNIEANIPAVIARIAVFSREKFSGVHFLHRLLFLAFLTV